MGDINLFRRIKTTDRGIEKVQDGISNLAQQARKAINDLKDSVTTTLLTATSAVIGTLTATTGTITTLTSTTSTTTTDNVTTANITTGNITTSNNTLTQSAEYQVDLTTALTAGGAGVDAANKSFIRVDTSGGSITINNLSGGEDGQMLIIAKVNGANTLTLLNGNGTGGDPMYFPGGASKAINNLGGIWLYYNGTAWIGLDA